MCYLGIDISKFKHDCAVIDDSGEIITSPYAKKIERAYHSFYFIRKKMF